MHRLHITGTILILQLPHQLIQLIILIPTSPDDLYPRRPSPALPPHRLLLLRHRAQKLLQLLLRDLAAQLARTREHDEPVLDVLRARGLDQLDPVEAVRGVGRDDLRDEGGAGFGLALALGVFLGVGAVGCVVATLKLGEAGLADLVKSC